MHEHSKNQIDVRCMQMHAQQSYSVYIYITLLRSYLLRSVGGDAQQIYSECLIACAMCIIFRPTKRLKHCIPWDSSVGGQTNKSDLQQPLRVCKYSTNASHCPLFPTFRRPPIRIMTNWPAEQRPISPISL